MTYLDTPKNNLINWLNNKLKKTLIYKISVRQLGLKFKWDNTLESKAIKHIVEKILLDDE